jgi:hypothetical protein
VAITARNEIIQQHPISSCRWDNLRCGNRERWASADDLPIARSIVPEANAVSTPSAQGDGGSIV